MFQQLATTGAGRPVDKDGFPSGPWTPDLLAEAITQIDANHAGIELRTVQLWFQDNNKGISSNNIRWLARVFGCGDPEATSAWQAELSAAQARLIAKRRQNRKITNDQPPGRSLEAAEGPAAAQPSPKSKRRMSLATRSEAIFSRDSPLDLPSTVFAGARLHWVSRHTSRVFTARPMNEQLVSQNKSALFGHQTGRCCL